jgi:hypothetical protein
VLLKAGTRSPCFSYPGPARAFISAGSADLSSFGGVSVGCCARFTLLVEFDQVKAIFVTYVLMIFMILADV